MTGAKGQGELALAPARHRGDALGRGGGALVVTIGHSTRPLDGLTALLQAHDVRMLADVRAFPRSRHNPQFNIDTLPAALAAGGHRLSPLPGAGRPAGGAARLPEHGLARGRISRLRRSYGYAGLRRRARGPGFAGRARAGLRDVRRGRAVALPPLADLGCAGRAGRRGRAHHGRRRRRRPHRLPAFARVADAKSPIRLCCRNERGARTRICHFAGAAEGCHVRRLPWCYSIVRSTS